MTIQSARFTLNCLDLTIDGRRAFVDTKKSLLDAGIAVLGDGDVEEPYWERTCQAELPADPDNGRHQPLPIAGGTRDLQVVDLARRYWDAVNSDDFAEQEVAL